MMGDVARSLQAVAAATLLLLCVGVHNAWDTVTYLTIVAIRHPGAPADAAPPPPPSPHVPRRRRGRRRR
jgi:hypothetical protein